MPDPTPCDLLITGGTVLDLDGDDGCIEADVAITGGTVVAVEPRSSAQPQWAPRRRVDASGAYVAPGFVDGHVHLSAILGAARPYQPASGPSLFGGGSTAAIGRALDSFLRLPVPDELVEAVVAPVLGAMALAGTSAVVDAGSAGIDGIVAAARSVGVRITVGPGIHDVLLDDDGALVTVADAGAVLAAAERWVLRHQGVVRAPTDPTELVDPVITVTEPTFCSDELLDGVADLASRTGAPITFHTHETATSVADHDRAHGRPALDRLADRGLLGPHCTLMHAGAVSDADVDLIAATGTTVNVNPLGNAMLGFGAAGGRALGRYVDAGVRLVLGSDYTPSMIASAFDLVHAALMISREVGGSDCALTLEQALRMAAAGTVSVGGTADLVVVDRTGPHHLGVDHPVPGLALRARPGDVRTVVVGGRLVVDDGGLARVDLRDLCARAGAALESVGARA